MKKVYRHCKAVAFIMTMALLFTSFANFQLIEGKKANKKKVKVSSVKINEGKSIRLQKGKRYKLSTTVKVNPNSKKYKKLKFTSSNKKIVQVNATGTIRGRSVGKAKITAISKTDTKKKASISVTVTKDVLVSKIVLNRTSVTETEFYEDDIKLSVKKIYPSNAKNKDMIWSTSDEDIADVDEDGNVSLGNVGTAIITATAKDKGGAKATCTVKVLPFGEDKADTQDDNLSDNPPQPILPVVTPTPVPTPVPIEEPTPVPTEQPTPTPTPVPTEEPNDIKTTVVENFESYATGTNWDQYTTGGQANPGTMTVVTDPLDPNNKVLKVDYNGTDRAYDFAPYFRVDLATIPNAKEKLGDYVAMKFKVRVVSNSYDCQLKTIGGFFADYGTINRDMANNCFYTPDHAEVVANPAKFKFLWSLAGMLGADGEVAGSVNGNLMNNNRFMPQFNDDFWGMDAYENKTMDQTKRMEGFAGYNSDTNYIEKAEYSIKTLDFVRTSVNCKPYLDKSKFDMTFGSYYQGQLVAGEKMEYYIDDIELVDGKVTTVPATSLKVDPVEKEMEAGDKFQLTTTVLPENTTDAIEYSSSDDKVARVAVNGVVTAVGEGNATITVKANNNVKSTCRITVKEAGREPTPTEEPVQDVPITSIRVLPNEKVLFINENIQLMTSIIPLNATDTVKYVSSNPAVATVTDYGYVTAVSTGSAIITVSAASDGGIEATCQITVKEDALAVNGIYVDKPTAGDLIYGSGVVTEGGIFLDATKSEYIGMNLAIPECVNIVSCGSIKLKFTLSDVSADELVKFTLGYIHKDATSNWDEEMTDPEHGRIKEVYYNINAEDSESGSCGCWNEETSSYDSPGNITYDNETGEYTILCNLADIDGLENAKYIMLARNGSESVPFKLLLKEVEYIWETDDTDVSSKTDPVKFTIAALHKDASSNLDETFDDRGRIYEAYRDVAYEDEKQLEDITYNTLTGLYTMEVSFEDASNMDKVAALMIARNGESSATAKVTICKIEYTMRTSGESASDTEEYTVTQYPTTSDERWDEWKAGTDTDEGLQIDFSTSHYAGLNINIPTEITDFSKCEIVKYTFKMSETEESNPEEPNEEIKIVQYPTTSDERWTVTGNDTDDGLQVDFSTGNYVGLNINIPAEITDFSKCKAVRCTFKMTDVSDTTNPVKFSIAALHKEAESNWDESRDDKGRIYEAYRDAYYKSVEQNGGTTYDPVTDLYTIQVDLTGQSCLGQVAAFMFARNGFASSTAKITICKIEYIMRAPGEADPTDSYPFLDVPFAQDFEDEDAVTSDTFSVIDIGETKIKYMRTEGLEGSACLYIPSGSYNGLSTLLDNRKGVEDKNYYVECYVKAATDEDIDGEVFYYAGYSEYAGFAKAGTNFDQMYLKNDWYKMHDIVTVPAGAFVDLRIRGSKNFLIDNIKIEEYTDQDITDDDYPKRSCFAIPIRVSADLSEEPVDSWDYTISATESGIAVKLNSQYATVKFPLSNPVMLAAYDSIDVKFNSSAYVNLRFYDEDGNEISELVRWCRTSDTTTGRDTWAGKVWNGVDVTTKIAYVGFMANGEAVDELVIKEIVANPATTFYANLAAEGAEGSWGNTVAATEGGITVNLSSQYAEHRVALPVALTLDEIKDITVKFSSDANLTLKYYDADGNAISSLTRWCIRSDTIIDCDTWTDKVWNDVDLSTTVGYVGFMANEGEVNAVINSIEVNKNVD